MREELYGRIFNSVGKYELTGICGCGSGAGIAVSVSKITYCEEVYDAVMAGAVHLYGVPVEVSCAIQFLGQRRNFV